jgi:hypothetical protein
MKPVTVVSQWNDTWDAVCDVIKTPVPDTYKQVIANMLAVFDRQYDTQRYTFNNPTNRAEALYQMQRIGMIQRSDDGEWIVSPIYNQ